MGRKSNRARGNAKPATPRKVQKPADARVHDLEKRLAEAVEREAEASKRAAEAVGQLQTRDRELAEAQEQQTATSEILRVISSSPTDYQPVFDTIVSRAGVVCGAVDAVLWTVDGDELVVRAHHGPIPATIGARQPTQGSVAGGAVREARIVHVEDLTQADDFPVGRDIARRLGWRSTLSAPLLREGVAIGAILVRRSEVHPFTDNQIALLQTFADEAVIAIENVRLFTELEASNRELTTALDKQTATSDILRVISRSQTDVQPVFEAILSSAVGLLGAYAGVLTRVVDNQIELAAFSRTDDAGAAALRAAFPQSLQSGLPHAQAIRDRAPLNIADAQTDPRLPEAEHVRAGLRGFRSRVLVPLLRQDEAIGAISLARREPGGFNADEISLLRTFADQAVIAIENARLLTALQARTDDLTRSVEQLTALGDVGRAVSSTLDLETVLSTIVSRAVELSGLDGGVVFEYDEGAEEFVHRVATEVGGALAEARRSTRVRKGEGVVGQTALTLEPAQVVDITVPGAYESRLRENLIASGVRAVLAVPMVREGELIGCLVVSRNRPGEFTADTIELLRTFATQSALAIQNARLFREIELKSRELEAASRHKSEFLANMSHELRTPLNAIIGFSEVLSERLFGELNAKQDEYLKDIHASGQHLLSLINDILDLSKIEAGKMELELSNFDLPTTIDNALMLVRERAARRGIALHKAVDGRLGQIEADERKIRQVLLNLLSNAIKFTPEGGRIEVGAQAVDGSIEVSVTDTGIGIAPEDQEAVLEEFRQVGSAEKKVEGTGLGLALSRKFIELHGGRISVKSQEGQGATFTFTIRRRRGE
jgi:signal transduction histidine kinase